MNPEAVLLSDHSVQELKVNQEAKMKTSENNIPRGLNFIPLPMGGVPMFPLSTPLSGNPLARANSANLILSSMSPGHQKQAISTSRCISSSSNFMKGPLPLPPKFQLSSVTTKAIASKGIPNSSQSVRCPSIKSNFTDPQQQLFLCLLQQQQVSALKLNNQSKFIIGQNQTHHLKFPAQSNSSMAPIVLACATTSAPLATNIKLLPNRSDAVPKRDTVQNVFRLPVDNVKHDSETLEFCTAKKPHILIRKTHSHTDVALKHLNDSASNKSFQHPKKQPARVNVPNGLKVQPCTNDLADVVLLEKLIQKKKLLRTPASKPNQLNSSSRSILKTHGLSRSHPKSSLTGQESFKSCLKSVNKINDLYLESIVNGVNNIECQISNGECGPVLKRQSSLACHNNGDKSICSRKKKVCLNNIKLEGISNSTMRNLTTPSYRTCTSMLSATGTSVFSTTSTSSSSDESDGSVPCLDRSALFVGSSFDVDCSSSELPLEASSCTSRQDRIRCLQARQRQRFLSMRRRLLCNDSSTRNLHPADVKHSSSHCEEVQVERSREVDFGCRLSEVVEDAVKGIGKRKSRQGVGNSELRSCLHRDHADKSCLQPALPYSNHCCRHIMYCVDQQLFSYCTAKSADNMQCCVPVLNTRYSIPLCSDHRDWNPKKKEQCSDNLEASKKAKKKSKSTSLLRTPKKGKKKAKSIPADVPYGSSPGFAVKGEGDVPRAFVSVDEAVEEPTNSNAIHQAIPGGTFNENPPNNSDESDAPSFDFQPTDDVISKDDALDDDVLSTDLLKDLDPTLLIDPSYCFIDTHEIHDVFGKLPIEVFDFIPNSLR